MPCYYDGINYFFVKFNFTKQAAEFVALLQQATIFSFVYKMRISH